MKNKKNNSPLINSPISIGELIDKITILEIKQKNIKGERLENVNKELNFLRELIEINNLKVKNELLNDLRKVNQFLWDIEDKIRKKEKLKEFDEEFIEIARSVYIQNDKRCAIKREINIKYNSDIIEEKSY